MVKRICFAVSICDKQHIIISAPTHVDKEVCVASSLKEDTKRLSNCQYMPDVRFIFCRTHRQDDCQYDLEDV